MSKTYNKTEREVIANGFREAKKLLAIDNSLDYFCSNKVLYICFALTNAYRNLGISSGTMYLCKGIIEERLKSHAYLDQWLERRVGRAKVEWDAVDNFSRQIQATRHAWLDSLIKEFSE